MSRLPWSNNLKILKNYGRVAEWSALQTGKRGDSNSIPAEVKTFFGGIKRVEQYIASHFELNYIFLN